MSQKLGCPQVQALSETMSDELATSGVSCVLNWHNLSEGHVHWQQRGHTSLKSVLSVVCVELAQLVRRASQLAAAWTHESRVCGVSCVELTQLVRRTVVVRVTDRWHRAVGHALHTTIHVETARHFVEHPLSFEIRPNPTLININQCCCKFFSHKIVFHAAFAFCTLLWLMSFEL